jgi:hypothetical protein
MIFTEECNTIIEWDYKEWIRVSNFPGLVDCGIVEKINKVSASIHKKTLRGGANTIVINPVHRDIFLRNKYYNSDDNRLWGGRYKIEFSEFINKDIIFLYNYRVESDDITQKKKKNYLGIIKIKNIYI